MCGRVIQLTKNRRALNAVIDVSKRDLADLNRRSCRFMQRQGWHSTEEPSKESNRTPGTATIARLSQDLFPRKSSHRSDSDERGATAGLIAENLLIFGLVANWRPVKIFLYE
jgi:hypothetical protein